jgi:hypothetical protein
MNNPWMNKTQTPPSKASKEPRKENNNMKATATLLASLAVLAWTTTASRADSWAISIGGGSAGGGFGFHYSSGGGKVVAVAPVHVHPAPVVVAPAPAPVCVPRIIHVSPQVVTHRSWRARHYARPVTWVAAPQVCATPRPVLVVAGCR